MDTQSGRKWFNAFLRTKPAIEQRVPNILGFEINKDESKKKLVEVVRAGSKLLDRKKHG